MTSIKAISWFRLFVVIGLSLATSLSMFFGDEVLTRGEIFNTLLQAAIVGFSFLQCPEMQAERMRRIINAQTKNNG